MVSSSLQHHSYSPSSPQCMNFLMVEHLNCNIDRFRVWHVDSVISDHVLVCLQIGLGETNRHFPFKFNHHWLSHPDFQLLVRQFWESVIVEPGLNIMDRLLEKPHLLKVRVREWDRRQKMDRVANMECIEAEIDSIFQRNAEGLFSFGEKDRLQ